MASFEFTRKTEELWTVKNRETGDIVALYQTRVAKLLSACYPIDEASIIVVTTLPGAVLIAIDKRNER